MRRKEEKKWIKQRVSDGKGGNIENTDSCLVVGTTLVSSDCTFPVSEHGICLLFGEVLFLAQWFSA